MATAAKVYTDEELMQLPEDGYKRELVDGEIEVSPAGAPHGRICVRLAARLLEYASAKGLGEVFDSSTGVRLPNNNLRVPDVCFVSAQRLPGGTVPEGFLRIPPDLVVEVLSPGDRPRMILDRIGDHLTAGTRLVWIIDPERGTAAAYRSLTDVTRLTMDGTLDGEDVLPGFRLPLAELLA